MGTMVLMVLVASGELLIVISLGTGILSKQLQMRVLIAL
jgi:hypothetical protein